MRNRAQVFEKTYHSYLAQVRVLVQSGGMDQKADILGINVQDDEIRVRFFNLDYLLTPDGLYDGNGSRPHFSDCVVLFRYLIHYQEKTASFRCPDEAASRKWTAYKDFKDAAPLINYFTNDTESVIARNFSGRIPTLTNACRSLGGTICRDGLTSGFAMRVPALPRVPLFLVFYDGDAEFPATCSVLFERRADVFLDMESLGVLGARFAARLVRKYEGISYSKLFD